MRIVELGISHFRGIQSANIAFPENSRMLCLIGAGDSTKSTLLKAIEWITWPSWNLTVSDSDFFNQDVNAPIILTGSFAELPDKLLSEDKFGLYLRKPFVPLESYGSDVSSTFDDEPQDGMPLILTIQLTINNNLEPKWEVVCNRMKPKVVTSNERKLFCVDRIGENYSKDFCWGKFSALQKYADAQGSLQNARTQAFRAAAHSVDLHELDEISDVIYRIGGEYGVSFNTNIKNCIHLQSNGSVSAIIGLFDGEIPLTQKGTGSQRLLSMGLNISASQKNGILLIDEIENGLEPYRLRSLINELRSTCSDTGQIIMTTHSPIAVAECNISELVIVHSASGQTEVFEFTSHDANANKVIQKEIRSNPESFLCKRIIICEGKTEMGFIRSLDTYLSNSKQFRIAFKGVGTADGDGDNIFYCAEVLKNCGYEICLLMDSDNPDNEGKKADFQNNGVKIFDWDNFNAFEEQIFSDVPTDIAEQIIDVAVQDKGLDSVKSGLKDNNIPFGVDNNQIILSNTDNSYMKAIGNIAKRCKWYKRIGLGESVGNIIFENIDKIDSHSGLRSLINELISWVTIDDTTRGN